MKALAAFELTVSLGIDIYIGVPDSFLKNFIRSIEEYRLNHIVVTNEAHAIAIAYGCMMSKKNPCVYLQNSGLGNIINPLTSLCLPSKVLPLLIIGHRHTMEQHRVMGDVDSALLKLIGYPNYILVEEDKNVK